MTEEHAPLPPVLTLEEAAEAASSRFGEKWTARSILGCAARGEISIFARIPTACRLVRVEPLDGEENEFTAPAGGMPRISAKAVDALLAAGVATFDELTYPRTAEFFGEKFTEMATVWKIAEGDAAPEITPDSCRVMEYSLEQLADRYAAKPEAAPHDTPAAKVEAAPDAKNPNEKPLLQQQFQEREILRVIRELSHEPKNLPQNKQGKSGVKAEVRQKLSFPAKVFDKAWERLRASQDIQNAE